MRDERHLRTLLVGIDGACLPVLRPLFDAGAVPTLRSLVGGGVHAPMESSMPPWTPSAWPSLYTGKNPGKHGVFGFLEFDGYDWEVVDATAVRERPLWQLLDRHGLTSVVVNVPVTHPPRSFDGALVPGYTAPEDPTCHPEGLLAEVREAVGDYRVYPRREGDRSTVEAYREAVESRGAAFRHLAAEFDPDFGFLQFQATDTVCHEHPGDRTALRAVYEAVDRELRRTISACDPDTVIVASDHGIGPLSGSECRVNEHLRREGFLETTADGEGMPTWARVRDRRLREGEADTTPEPGALDRVGAALASVGVTSQRVAGLLERVGLREAVAARLPAELASAGAERVDFPGSRAYVRSRVECGVRVNLSGREPDGVVDPDDYEAVRDRLIETLSNLEAPDGDPVFEEVVRREKYFRGSERDRAVDVVTVPRGFEHMLSTRVGDGTFGTPSEPWNHKREGVLALSGEAVGQGELSDPTIYDVAPTVLATLGVARDERSDGRVVGPVESAGNESYPRPEPRDGVDLKHEVATRLADMGYIE